MHVRCQRYNIYSNMRHMVFLVLHFSICILLFRYFCTGKTNDRGNQLMAINKERDPGTKSVLIRDGLL